MLEIAVESNFSAAHQLRGYDGACKNVHGHNFSVEVTVSVKRLNKIGIGIDFLDIKQDVDHLLQQLEHKHLNELAPFKKVNPTSENLAIWLFQNLAKKMESRDVKLTSVSVRESSQFKATYYGKKKSK